MKKVLFLLLLLPLIAHAQDGVLSDPSYIENRAGQFWQVRTQVFESGAVLSREDPIGSDTSAVSNALVGSVFSNFRQYASTVVAVQRGFAVQRQRLGGVNAAFQALLGVSYLDAISAQLQGQYLGNYTLRVNGGTPRHVEIVRLASGVLRFRDGSANYVLDILSDNWIRVRNYPGAPAMLDLFFDGDSWIDASGNLGTVTYRLRKT